MAGAHRTAGAWPELGHHRGPQTLQVARARGEDEVDDIVGEREGRRDLDEADAPYMLGVNSGRAMIEALKASTRTPRSSSQCCGAGGEVAIHRVQT